MTRNLRIAYFAHSLRSDWNNGNAHFLRGLVRALGCLDHEVIVFEPESEWSIENLRAEAAGDRSLDDFRETYSDLAVQTYTPRQTAEVWREHLRHMDFVIFHEWNPPELAQLLLQVRGQLGYRILFHDTHHRASSSPMQMECFGLRHFDGILAFGETLKAIYRERYGVERVWTFHEAADTSVFKPLPEVQRERALVWIGNWGDDERTREIRQFLLEPAAALRDFGSTTIYGVRYPPEAIDALRHAGVHYAGYLANLDAPSVYAGSRATVHVPRQQYTGTMTGIPTIRVFEALACGIPLVSAPWEDTEGLFRPGDFQWASNTAEMTGALTNLLLHPAEAEAQAHRGLETILARHTCAHRAQQLTTICEEVL